MCAVVLRAVGRDEGADAYLYAALAARRFSRCALAAIVALALSGTVNAVAQVGSVAGLVGTPYGRLLPLKLGLLIPALALPALIRAAHLPPPPRTGLTAGRPPSRRLPAFVSSP